MSKEKTFVIFEGNVKGAYIIREVDTDLGYYGYDTLQEAQQALLRLTTEVNYDTKGGEGKATESPAAKLRKQQEKEERDRKNKAVTRAYRLKKG